VAADLADHAEGVPILRFHLYQPSVLEGCSDEAAGGTDAAEAVPGLRHHVLRSRDSERESVRFRRISANQFLSSLNTASVSNPNSSRDGTHASRWYLRLVSVRTISPFIAPIKMNRLRSVSYTHLRAHETVLDL